MLNKLLVILFSFFMVINPCFAQTKNITLGGKAICVVSGKSPVKRFIADANRLLILQSEGISKGSIQLQLIQDSDASLIDINILALLGQIDNLDSLFAGSIVRFESDSSETSLKKTVKSTNVTLIVNNSISEGKFIPVSGKIKVESPDQAVVNGTLNLKLSSSSLTKIKDLKNLGSSGTNGKLDIRCKLQNIPVEIKDLLSNI